MSLGERIRDRRKMLRMSQAYLGDKLGVTKSCVSSWEVDRTVPDVVMIERLAEVLEIPADTLLGYDVPEEEKKPEPVGVTSERAELIVLCAQLKDSDVSVVLAVARRLVCG